MMQHSSSQIVLVDVGHSQSSPLALNCCMSDEFVWQMIGELLLHTVTTATWQPALMVGDSSDGW